MLCDPLSFGNVAGDLGRSNDLAVALPDRRDCQGYVDEGAVLATANRLEMLDPLSSFDPSDNRRLFVQPVLGNKNGDRTPHGFGRRIAEQTLCAQIPRRDDPVQRFADNSIIRGFNDGGKERRRSGPAVPLLLLPAPLIGPRSLPASPKDAVSIVAPVSAHDYKSILCGSPISRGTRCEIRCHS